MAESQDQTERLLSALGGSGALPEALRHEALERFRETGLPTRRLESWKFTNLRALEGLSFGAAEAEAELHADRLPSLLPSGAERLRLVFVNGRFSAALSDKDLPAGLEIATLAEGAPAWAQEQLGQIAESDAEAPLLDLNTALASDGPLLRVAKGAVLAAPIELLFLDAGEGEEASAAQWRGLILLEESAEATVIEQHASQGSAASFTNGALEISVGPNAKLRHVRCQQRGERALQLTNTQVRIERDADYRALLVALGAGLAREDFRIALAGAGAHCGLNGAYLLGGEQHCDITTVITHEAPHTTCDEAIKGALDGKSQGVFQGLIKVERDSQRIEGNQSHHALLLSRTAEVDAKPELEIYADDVKCSHGATVGELDREALFYFRSRGIPERQARRMLIGSFLAEVIESFGEESLSAPLIALIEEKLDRVTGEEA
jgi:Fe-S cluster assembly protein SufD